MLQENAVLAPNDEPHSVTAISTEYAPGKPYIHRIEPELMERVPRRAKIVTGIESVSLLWLLNFGAGLGLSYLFAARNFPAITSKVAPFLGTGMLLIAVILLLAFLVRMLPLFKEFRCLRYGTAATGVFRSGSVNECEETRYRLVYQFDAGGRLVSDMISVTRSEYVRYTTANPYFTMLYYNDGFGNDTCMPYFRIRNR
jgi:hypothetical protein